MFRNGITAHDDCPPPTSSSRAVSGENALRSIRSAVPEEYLLDYGTVDVLLVSNTPPKICELEVILRDNSVTKLRSLVDSLRQSDLMHHVEYANGEFE